MMTVLCWYPTWGVCMCVCVGGVRGCTGVRACVCVCVLSGVGFKAVASLTVPGGKSSTFLILSSSFDQFFLSFLKLFSFSSSLWPSGWATHPPGKALATLLVDLYESGFMM